VADARGVALKETPIYLIDMPALHLDDHDQLERLQRTVAALRPRLLVLDPFIRVANIDENSAQEVSAVLGSLRALQREHDVAVLLVHHMRKSPSAHLGQQVRGSSDFAAWTDSAVYLVRQGPDDLVLSVEHRSAPAPSPLRIRLETDGPPHLVVEPAAPPTAIAASHPGSLRDAVLARLRGPPRSTAELRDLLKVRKATLLETLHELRSDHLVERDDRGWTLATPSLELAPGE